MTDDQWQELLTQAVRDRGADVVLMDLSRAIEDVASEDDNSDGMVLADEVASLSSRFEGI